MFARHTRRGAPSSSGDGTMTQLQVSAVTVAVCAIVIAYIDGFVVTSLREAVGAIEGLQSPFLHWLRDSTLMLPLFILAVAGALVVTRRWVGNSRREMVQLAFAALLIIAITTAVSIGQVASNSVHDYNVQAGQLGIMHSTHATTVAGLAGTGEVSGRGTCAALCAARHATFMVHLRAGAYASIVLLITNVVLAAWVLALRGGRLWNRYVTEVVQADEPMNQATETLAII